MKEIQPNEIWLVLDSLRYGGIETHTFELAKGLRKHQVAVRVILLKRYNERQTLIDKLSSANIPCNCLSDLFPSSNTLSALVQATKRYKPAIIHAHGYKASILCKMVKWCLFWQPVKQVSTYHAGETPKGKVKLYDFLDRYTGFISDLTLAVSKQIQAKLPFPSTHLNNFVDDVQRTEATGSQIAFVGRLSHEKAPDRFIALAQNFPDNSFHLYGTGPMEGGLKQTLESNSTQHNVHFHGYQSEMDDVWPEIDVLVICSRFEGLPMTALEAMTRGIVVIAVNVGDLGLLIRNEENGFITDSVKQLPSLLKYWLDLPEAKKNQIRTCAQKTIEQSYSQRAVISQLIEHYQLPTTS